MAVIIVIFLFILISFYSYLANKAYIKKKIRRTWGKFPEPRLIDDIDPEELFKSMEVLRKYYKKDFYIDSYTWQDLDFLKIFRKINKGYSSIGQDYLFYRLRNYDKANEDLEEFQKLKIFFQKDKVKREKSELNLYYIGKNRGLSLPYYVDNRVSNTKGRDKKIYLMGFLALISFLASIICFQVNQRIGIYLFSIFALLGLFNMAYYKNRSKYMLADIKNSAYLGNFLKRSKKFVKLDLPNSNKIKEILKKLGKLSFWMNLVSIEYTEDPFLILLEELKKVFLLQFIAYDQVDKFVEDKHREVLALFMEVGQIEASISTLNYQLALSFTSKPIFIDTYKIEGKNICHPLLKDPVANDLDFNKVNIITGSNASGKSTYVKSIAINAIFAQSLNFVFAEEFKLKKAGVFTSMAIKDDVVNGDSYFIAEIKSLKRIVDDLEDKKSYYFIDEILKGTNTIERIAASFSVITYLIEKSSLAMIASHDIELVSLFKDKVNNIHFREYIKENGDIYFDYKLKQGPSRTRNAIRLLESLGFCDEIVSLSQKMADQLSKEKEKI
ncbi:MAG: hypothetical protein PUG67_02040 [Peptoniphilaceae bacterium]|nr:hypothetical protein [Peptoniphilaceae bacterium]MDY6019209.1 hypothetical protein [Anaerococcus sp.]